MVVCRSWRKQTSHFRMTSQSNYNIIMIFDLDFDCLMSYVTAI